VRKRALVALGLATGLVASVAIATPSMGAECTGQGWTQTCVSGGGTQLDVGGSQTRPGSGGGGSADAGSGGVAGPGAFPPPPPRRLTPGERGTPDCAPDATVCVPVYTAPEADEPEAPADPAIPAVTLADLASFVPAAPALVTEPAAAGVVGMPTNVVAAASEHTQAGTLFGRAVTVRFTPSAYLFDYGDGTTARTDTGGASWADLGAAQFTATPTGHAWAARGTYALTVAVEYAAAVDFGGGFTPVAGVLTAAASPQSVTIYEVRTALVAQTCAEDPTGPGC
jgi:hypothetical protein